MSLLVFINISSEHKVRREKKAQKHVMKKVLQEVILFILYNLLL